ncbi:hypothetical protein I7X12_05650 [Halosimplex litoreum]|uniref:TraC-like domain-containing protein n=1 Tax=Halosimplex litoreum TaxID=1198301 RepID=A0A7T3KW78_9EURY|nr:hypothetical protein [Halosimplex litoreum]QPV64109.1 hypothetical protein I7X12_05650 [Halosimplex litoreum]
MPDRRDSTQQDEDRGESDEDGQTRGQAGNETDGAFVGVTPSFGGDADAEDTVGGDDARSDESVGSADDGSPESPKGDPDAHRDTRPPAQATDPTERGVFEVPNYTQDMLNFEFVLEADDDWVPEGVDGAGMVVVDEQKYVAILRVEPRSWSIHTAEKKSQIAETYQSAFLGALDFPIQIVSYPTRFDISDHVQRLDEIRERKEDARAASELIDVGRSIYPRWLDEFITKNDMKQRRFYVVAPVSVDMIQELQADSGGVLTDLADRFPPLASVMEFLGGDDGADVTRTQCVRELNARLGRIQGSLQRLDIQAERLRDRDEVLSVLYHYYNNQQPVRPGFDRRSSRSYYDPSASTGGVANE